MTQNIYSEPGQRGTANLQRVIDARSPEQEARDRERATIEFKIRVNKAMGAPTENLEAALAALSR